MSTAALFQWTGSALEPLDYCDPTEETLEAADSWRVHDGKALALDLHRARFTDTVLSRGFDEFDAAAFCDAVVGAIPQEGAWFPRVELVSRRGGIQLRFLHREAPQRTRSVTLATHEGDDPRREPRVKGPDLRALLAVRTAVQERGADDAVILSPEGYLVEGATSSIVWWVGDELCVVDEEFPRIPSVTERSLLALALALGVTVTTQRVRPADLDGREVWALGALHGIRIVTGWVDGPETAELPGRLRLWRDRLDALRKPIPRPS
ncbi:MAG TPA: aminotransferase class IV [Terrimesophilobacter sp.]|nr:aminotransferase class IV [Terrimesophilobacter sp.]HRP99083.1 aminotransferase class IV [Terrimesophilobacter sp.]